MYTYCLLIWSTNFSSIFPDKISESGYGCSVCNLFLKTLNMKTIKEEHHVTDASSESTSETAMANT